MKYILLLFLFVFTTLQATGAWMMSGRTHPELKWRTLETEHFDVHYHESIRDIAVQGASIAEQIRPTLMKQMGLNTLRRLDIVFTSEDEILNGFAMPSNHTVSGWIRMMLLCGKEIKNGSGQCWLMKCNILFSLIRLKHGCLNP